MFDTSLLMCGIIFSSIGMGYFMYGKNKVEAFFLFHEYFSWYIHIGGQM